MSVSDKIRGAANEAIGTIKRRIGKVIGSDRLKVAGSIQELHGEAQTAVGKAKDTARTGANTVDAAINRKR